MGNFVIRKATRQNQKLRLLLRGYAGSGKTYSALIMASELARSIPDSKILYIDTENGSSELYAPDFDYQIIDYLENFGENFDPHILIDMVKEIEHPNTIIIIDSLSHFWDGAGGILEIQHKAGGRFQDWMDVNPTYQEFVNTLIQTKSHLIVCARTKTEYALLEGGKKIEKLGTKTVGREGLDYEFTTVLDMTGNGFARADKDRSSLIPKEGTQVNTRLAQQFIKWLEQGVPTMFYTTIDQFATIFKKTRDEVVATITANYKVGDINQLTRDQVQEAQGKLQLTIDDVYKQAAEKKESKNKRDMDFLAKVYEYAKIMNMGEGDALRSICSACQVDEHQKMTNQQMEEWTTRINDMAKNHGDTEHTEPAPVEKGPVTKETVAIINKTLLDICKTEHKTAKPTAKQLGDFQAAVLKDLKIKVPVAKMTAAQAKTYLSVLEDKLKSLLS